MSKRLIVILTSLCAEGTPILVLELCRWWLQHHIQPTLALLNPEPQDLLPEFQQLDIPIAYWSLPKTGLQRYPALVHASYQLASRLQPDAVLSMPLGWHTFIAYGAKLAGVPTVAAHVGNYPPYWTGSAFQKFRLQMQLGRPVTDRLICCSHYIQQGVITHFGIPPRATITIYNAIPPSCSEGNGVPPPAPAGSSIATAGGSPPGSLIQGARPDDAVVSPSSQVNDNSRGSPNPIVLKEDSPPVIYSPERPFTIGMVARLEQHKDQPTLIRAAKVLQDQGYPFQVLLIGEGSRRSEYETLIHQLDLHDHVHLLGMRRDIPALLQQMDAFAFAAKPDEGFGIALAEAMAAGVPIVATDVGACQEVLEGGRLGLLVPPGNPEALAQGLRQILEHPIAAYQQAAAAQAKALQAFTIETMAQKYAHCLGLIP